MSAEQATPFGEALFEELLWVHGALRRDLATVRRLAAEASGDLDPAELRAALTELETSGPLWQLRFSCLHYCRFVHLHHGLEDRHLLPILRRADPSLAPVIDRLEAEHRTVSDLLDEAEAAAAALGQADDEPARARVTLALDAVADHLLAHLEYEEERLAPAIKGLSRLG